MIDKDDPRGYPADQHGAVMKDPDGNELFVSTQHDAKAVERRLKLPPVRVKDGKGGFEFRGWELVEDHRAHEAPAAPADAAGHFAAAAQFAAAASLAGAVPGLEREALPHVPGGGENQGNE